MTAWRGTTPNPPEQASCNFPQRQQSSRHAAQTGIIWHNQDQKKKKQLLSNSEFYFFIIFTSHNPTCCWSCFVQDAAQSSSQNQQDDWCFFHTKGEQPHERFRHDSHYTSRLLRVSTHRLLNVVPGVLRGPVQAGVVDDHALYDVGHLIFQLQMGREHSLNNAGFTRHMHSADHLVSVYTERFVMHNKSYQTDTVKAG